MPKPKAPSKAAMAWAKAKLDAIVYDPRLIEAVNHQKEAQSRASSMQRELLNLLNAIEAEIKKQKGQRPHG